MEFIASTSRPGCSYRDAMETVHIYSGSTFRKYNVQGTYSHRNWKSRTIRKKTVFSQNNQLLSWSAHLWLLCKNRPLVLPSSCRTWLASKRTLLFQFSASAMNRLFSRRNILWHVIYHLKANSSENYYSLEISVIFHTKSIQDFILENLMDVQLYTHVIIRSHEILRGEAGCRVLDAEWSRRNDVLHHSNSGRVVGGGVGCVAVAECERKRQKCCQCTAIWLIIN